MAYMKSINLAKPVIMMIVGLPGAGKSFFARQFSETFNAPVVSYDRIHYEIFEEPAYDNDEHMTVLRLFSYQIDELAKTGRTFMVDGGLSTKAERAALRQFAKKVGYDTMVVWVQTDTATCRLRALKRSTRRMGDRYNKSLPPEIFQAYAERLTHPNAQENYIVISGKHTYATQARTVLRKLAAPRSNSATVEPPTRRNITITTPPAPPVNPPERRSVTIN